MAENQPPTPPVGGDTAPPADPPPAPPEAPDELQPLPEDEPVDLHTIKERNRELAALRARNRELEESQEQLRQAQLTEHEKALEEAKAAGFAEAETQYKAKLLQSRIYALATGDFADPGDVHRFLDLDAIDADITEVDLSKVLAKLLDDKPYLAVKPETRLPTPPQGPRGADTPASPKKDWLRDVMNRG